MKKILYIIWVAVVLMIGLLFIQNQSLYLTKQSLNLNMLLIDITLPPISNGVILLIFFFGGILLSAAGSMMGRLKTRKALKRCKATGDGYIDKIGVLKNQLDEMKSHSTPKTTFKSSLMNPAAGGDHAPA
ncbi:MAG: hypothetical protein KQI78_15105 [Deltaproteobacteria bacterium]|nr:hypothetical protein [Deltaproteobacteria bacterium]